MLCLRLGFSLFSSILHPSLALDSGDWRGSTEYTCISITAALRSSLVSFPLLPYVDAVYD
jgi:hypothetical protein